MRYEEILAQVKIEARVKDDSTFNAICIGILNDLFKEAISSQRPFEFKKESSITLTANQDLFDLPADFFVHHEILYWDVDTSRTYPLTDEDKSVEPAPRGLYGHPRSFEILTENKVYIKPSEGIVTGDELRIIYYKTPPIVTTANLTTNNPLPRLEPFLLRAAIQRVRMFHTDDPAAMQLLNGMVTSAAKGFANDEPPKPNLKR
jgi:hypothetical protein